MPRAPTKSSKRYVQGGIAAGGLILVTFLLASLKPAAPSVDREVVSLDAVRRGTMVREVRGPGTLVPEHIRWISALTPARVERIFVQPGTPVQANTVLLELANPDVQIEALDAQRQLTAAEGELVNLRTSLQGARLTQAGVVASTRSLYLWPQSHCCSPASASTACWPLPSPSARARSAYGWRWALNRRAWRA